MSSSATEAHTGSRSLRIANIPGNPNDEYVNGITASHAKLTFWVWTDSTPASSRTVVAWRDTSDNLLLEFVVGSAGGFAVVTSCEAEPQVVGVFAWTVETWTSVEIIFNDDTGFLSVDIGGSGPATRETGCTTQVENLAVVEDTAGTPVFFMDDFELTAIEAATVRPPIMRTQ